MKNLFRLCGLNLSRIYKILPWDIAFQGGLYSFHAKPNAYSFGCRKLAMLFLTMNPASDNSCTCRQNDARLIPYFFAVASGNVKSRRPPLSSAMQRKTICAPVESAWKAFDRNRELPIWRKRPSEQSARAESQGLIPQFLAAFLLGTPLHLAQNVLTFANAQRTSCSP